MSPQQERVALDKTLSHPWRLTAADYRAADARTPCSPQPGRLTEV